MNWYKLNTRVVMEPMAGPRVDTVSSDAAIRISLLSGCLIPEETAASRHSGLQTLSASVGTQASSKQECVFTVFVFGVTYCTSISREPVSSSQLHRIKGNLPPRISLHPLPPSHIDPSMPYPMSEFTQQSSQSPHTGSNLGNPVGHSLSLADMSLRLLGLERQQKKIVRTMHYTVCYTDCRPGIVDSPLIPANTKALNPGDLYLHYDGNTGHPMCMWLLTSDQSPWWIQIYKGAVHLILFHCFLSITKDNRPTWLKQSSIATYNYREGTASQIY
ncbi:hypothetical protein K439DRAFT_1664908 [Ramaria rubella]|nr:hypothetical protein K439DRAFT_1664908 [Ramaria rubella]